MSDPPSELTFGIMCDGTEFGDWQAECIRRLLDVDGVEPELLIVRDGGRSGLGGKLSKLLEYRDRTNTRDAINKASWYLYEQLTEDPPCDQRTDLSAELASADRLRCEVEQDGFSQYFYEDDLERIEEHDLDFVLRFAFGIIRGEILDVPRYGVWSFHHDDERRYRGGPPCFWEIYEGDPVTGAVLQRLTDRLDGGVILERGFFSTNEYSYNENRNDVFYGTAEWPARVATDILNGNAEYVDRPPTRTDAPIYRSPSPRQLLLYNLKRARSLGDAVLAGISQWNVGVAESPIEAFADGDASPRIEWHPRPKEDGYVADPFPVDIDGSTYIFVEDFDYASGKGKISYVEYPDGFRNGDLRTAHEEPFHMSYPYLFTHDGEVYATPEMYEADEIRLYRLDAPDDWKAEATLVPDVAGVDPTVVERDGRWWLFFTRYGYENTKLHVWHAPELIGGWEPHENNPVKTDVRSARPAGTPFVRNGELYRPAQHCAGVYGERIVINRVTDLTPTRYAEEEVREITAPEDSPYPTRRHTISSNGEVTVFDGNRTVRNKHALMKRANQVASRLLG